MRAASRRRHNEYEVGFSPGDPDELWRVNWRDLGLPYCGVYVVTTDSLYPCKIGVSVNPVKRLTGLQTSHWRALQISGYRWAETTSDARRVEREVHLALSEKGKSLLGEWFDVRVQEAVEAIEWAALAANVAINRHIPDVREVRAMMDQLSTDACLDRVYKSAG